MKHLRWLLFLFCVPAYAQFVPHAPAKGGYCLNPSNVWIPINASMQTGSALPNGAPAGDLYGLNSNGTWYGLACDASGKLIIPNAGSPDGSDYEIQIYKDGDFFGTPGGNTNAAGTHWAFGAGSAVDTGTILPPQFPTPIGPTIQVVNETSTDPALESGQFVNVTLNPASTATAGGASAAITQLDMEGTGGWAGSNVVANAQLVQAIYNSPDDASATLEVTGSAATVFNTNTGGMQYAWGTTPSVQNIGGGTIGQGVGTESSVSNDPGGSMSIANANYAYLNLNGIGTTAFASLYSDDTGLDTVDTQTVTTWVGYNFGAAPTVTNGGSITNLYGIYLADMNTGTNNWQIYSAGTAPSYFAGPIESSTLTETAAAPTVTSGQVGFGGTTAAASNCNQSGVLTGVIGCNIINVAGTPQYLPYF